MCSPDKIDLSISLFNSLDEFITYAFTQSIQHKAYLWGVYPVYNPFYREKRKDMINRLNYIVGAFYGIINRPDLKDIALTITRDNGQKEDVERTLKYFLHDGVVLRFNKIAFKTKYYGCDGGGLGTFKNRVQPMLQACTLLKEQYSDYGEIKTRKNGMAEFVFKKKWGGGSK